jgi:hypothetical protein
LVWPTVAIKPTVASAVAVLRNVFIGSPPWFQIPTMGTDVESARSMHQGALP